MDNKNEPVQLSGKVSVNKEGEGKRFFKLFFAGSFKEALKYAFSNVFVPYTKDAICKTSTNVVNYWVNGDKPISSQQSGARNVSYWNAYNTQRTPVNPPTQRISNVYSVGTLCFEEMGDAEVILLKMKELLVTYKSVSVADLFELAGEKFSFTDYDYGWRNLDNASVKRTPDGKYVIDLPKVTPLK